MVQAHLSGYRFKYMNGVYSGGVAFLFITSIGGFRGVKSEINFLTLDLNNYQEIAFEE